MDSCLNHVVFSEKIVTFRTEITCFSTCKQAIPTVGMACLQHGNVLFPRWERRLCSVQENFLLRADMVSPPCRYGITSVGIYYQLRAERGSWLYILDKWLVDSVYIIISKATEITLILTYYTKPWNNRVVICISYSFRSNDILYFIHDLPTTLSCHPYVGSYGYQVFISGNTFIIDGRGVLP